MPASSGWLALGLWHSWADAVGVCYAHPRCLVEGIIDPTFEIFVHKSFRPGTKIRAAQQVTTLPDERLRQMLGSLAQTLGAVLDYIGVEEPAVAEANTVAIDPEEVAT